MRKILLLIDTLGAGGAERCLIETCVRMPDYDLEPLLICLNDSSHGFKEEISGRGFEPRILESRPWIGKLRELRSLIKEQRPSLVHTVLFPSDILGRLACAGISVPVVSSLVSTSYEDVRLLDPNVRRSRLEAARLLDSWTARHLTTHFHAVSETARASAMGKLGLPAEKITVIERGHDPERLGAPSRTRKRQMRRAFGLTDEDQVVVNIARQDYQKGQKYLLEAAPALKRRHPRLQIMIAGRRGHASVELERLRSAQRMESYVHFLGHIDNVEDLLAAADLFVFPSLYEGLGNAVIEAMALGLPVVVTDVPALREVVEEGRSGLFFTLQSSDELGKAISTLLDDPERAEAFGRRGRQIFLDRFTMDRYMPRIVDLYRGVVANGGA